MKYYISLSFIALMLLSFSCETEAVEENISNEDSVDPVTPGRPTFFASINRGACYGTCPIYEMFIYKNGTAILKGIRFIDQIGTYETILTDEEVQEFTDTALEIGFMDLEDEYDSLQISDLPTITTMINIDGVQKTVLRRSGYPQKIKIYEALFDAILESKEWRKID